MEGVHSGGVGSILKYIGGYPVGGSPLDGGRINKIGLQKGGGGVSLHACVTMGILEHVDRALN